MVDLIPEFQGRYRFLSNFWSAEVELDGIIYPSVEYAYQAAKSFDPSYRERIRKCNNPGATKKLGRNIILRGDWNNVRLSIMYMLLKQKFRIPELRDKLLSTGTAMLIEGNYWGDTYWGVCRGRGENNLGKLIMQVRSELLEV